jgi:hypothetical protein
MGRRLASEGKEVRSKVLRKFQLVGIGVSSYVQAGCTIETSIHETSSEEHLPIESKVKYMYRINPQGYQACVVEVEVEAYKWGRSAVGGVRRQECRERGGGGSTLQGAGLAVLGRQYKHEALVYNIFYCRGESIPCGNES